MTASGVSDGFRKQRERGNALLVDFLTADLNLGFTYIHTAALTSSPEHHEQAIDNVRTIVDTVHRFGHRIEDAEKRSAIIARANQLAAAIGG